MKNIPGARLNEEQTATFTVWAPFAKEVKLAITHPQKQTISMKSRKTGYWKIDLPEITQGTLYKYIIDDKDPLPDPASLSQPQGVHGPSEVVNLKDFKWQDHHWNGVPPEKMIIYELHVGTFSPEQSFEGIINKLAYLKDLGINTIEIMPVGQFPGHRNWGYDGVYPFAVQNSYGGPFGLMKLVNACHQEGLAVILDVIYNHLGPEGNYLSQFGPYFTDNYKTPWGQAINFDDKWCDEVRNYFLQNALMWIRDFHIDALRLDAIHAIKDFGARHFLRELAGEVKQYNRKSGQQHFLIGESNLNDVKVIQVPEAGGFGLDAQWHDEFHHVLHTLLTGESQGYYQDFGAFHQLAKLLTHVFIYDGIYSPFHQRTYGNKAASFPGSQFIVCTQNHDQVGNRMLGERLSQLVDLEALKLAAGFMMVSPFVPMLFMGEEYGAKSPFLYFVDHGDPRLNKLVKEGRKKEFAEFHQKGTAPDPAAEKTFNNSCLQWDYQDDPNKSKLLAFYKKLISLRKNHTALQQPDRENMHTWEDRNNKLLLMERWQNGNHLYCIFNFDNNTQNFTLPGNEKNQFSLILDSSGTQWGGLGSSLETNLTSKGKITVPAKGIIIYEAI